MRALEQGFYILSESELDALVQASIGKATRMLHRPGYAPCEDMLPHVVNVSYKLLHNGACLYSEEALNGALAADDKNGVLIEDEWVYDAVKAAFGVCALDVHAVYAPEGGHMLSWFSAAVDLFRPGQTYRVYFFYEGNGRIHIEHLDRWWFG